MGKRSDFKRVERDFYETPMTAITPLIAHLEFGVSFCEPCVGRGALAVGLEECGMSCHQACDIHPMWEDAYECDALSDRFSVDFDIDMIITNPPWDRKILHPMIESFSDMRPTWLLFDSDWVHTKQSAPFMPRLRKIVSVGRVKWIPDSKMTGKDNCAWHLFDKPSDAPTEFYGRV